MFYSEKMCFFTFEEGMIRISNVSLLYCHCHFVLPLKQVFLYRNLQPMKVSVVRRCPLRTVIYIEFSL